jgi:hypothetical protein
MTTDFDPYSVNLDREARRMVRRFPQLNYEKAAELLDEKAKGVQLSYSESNPPLHGCVVPLNQSDIDSALDRGILQ